MDFALIIALLTGATLLYTYAGYPLLLWWLSSWRGRWTDTQAEMPDGTPTVSVIVPFHNEEAWVARKLENALGLDYPRGRLEIIAVSDGSTDRTLEVLDRYRHRVRILAYPTRQGKPTALNRALAVARGDIIVFTDANVVIDPKAIRALVNRHREPGVGAVCGNVSLQALHTGEPLGEGLYMRYERLLFAMESRFGGMVNADGALFSIRRALYKPLAADTITDDFVLALQVVSQRRRVVYEQAATAVEAVVPDVTSEFHRKVRMIAGGYQAIWRQLHLLNAIRYPVTAWQLISHKLLRWLVPFWLVGLLFGSVAQASRQPVWAVFATLQCSLYVLAAVGWLSPAMRRFPLVYIPYYFCAVNVGALLGAWRFASGKQTITWRKVHRAA